MCSQQYLRIRKRTNPSSIIGEAQATRMQLTQIHRSQPLQWSARAAVGTSGLEQTHGLNTQTVVAYTTHHSPVVTGGVQVPLHFTNPIASRPSKRKIDERAIHVWLTSSPEGQSHRCRWLGPVKGTLTSGPMRGTADRSPGDRWHKQGRAQGGCLGVASRRRTWQRCDKPRSAASRRNRGSPNGATPSGSCRTIPR